MARGSEVLRAAIEERRRVRPVGCDTWLHLNKKWRFVTDTGARTGLVDHDAYFAEWEIEPEPAPPTEGLTFAEAVAAMDRGAVVTRADGDGWLWRKSPDGSWFQCADAAEPDRWGPGHLDYHDVHATDWRIAEYRTADDRPTFQQLAQWLRTWEGLDGAWKTVYAALDAARERWPAMFREEDKSWRVAD